MPAGWKQVPAHVKRRMQAFAQELGDRAQFNLGWHAAQQGDELDQAKSTSAINAEMSRLIETIERYGKAPAKRGRPKKASNTPQPIDLAIGRECARDPQKRSLAFFIERAVAAGRLRHATPEWHAKRIRKAMKQAKK